MRGLSAGEIELLVKNMDNFAGIFSLSQLKNVKIIGVPVGFIVNANQHWISVYISDYSVEIMDSLGYLAGKNVHLNLINMLCCHIYGKELLVTPKLQADASDNCGKFAVSFLYFRILSRHNLERFASVFSQDYDENSVRINEIFKTVEKLSCNL